MSKFVKRAAKRIKVGNKYIGEREPTFFVAEIGNNHNGDFYLAKKSIEEAAACGADAVKFQKRFPSETFTKKLLEKPQTKDQVFGKTYGEYREKLELSKSEFVRLKGHAQKLGVIFFATPFDKKSVDFLEDVGVGIYKIASFDVTNIPLVEYVAKKGKPIILSLGMSTIEEADGAINTILQHNTNLVILYCLSIYPTPDEKHNLSTISYLKKRYSPIPVGYSGHEKDILPTIATITLGAVCVERHFTLNKTLPGPDHSTVSIEPAEFRQMVENARRIERILGTPVKKLWDEEKETRKKHGKSLVSKTSILKGTVITDEMVTVKSPGYGLKPNMKKKILGKKATCNIPEDTVIKKEFIK